LEVVVEEEDPIVCTVCPSVRPARFGEQTSVRRVRCARRCGVVAEAEEEEE
jgi:hypothetical protein